MSQKRKAISLETKYEVIQKRQRGEKAGDLMKEYSLASSTVATILKNLDKIIKEYELQQHQNVQRASLYIINSQRGRFRQAKATRNRQVREPEMFQKHQQGKFIILTCAFLFE